MNLYEKKILKYVYPIFQKEGYFPNYLHYGGMDPNATLSALYNAGYIRDCSMEENLSKELSADLKTFCKSHGLKTSGKKADILSRISEYCTECNISYPLKTTYLTLSDKGLSEIEDIKNIAMDDVDFFCVGKYKIQEIIENWDFETLLPAEKIFMQLDFSYIWKDRAMEELSKKTLIAFHRMGFRNEHLELFFSDFYNTKIQLADFIKASKFFHGIDELLGYKKLENNHSSCFEYYEVRNMNDERTCEHCRCFEGKRLPFSDAKIGVTFPPFYNCSSDYCRCYIKPLLK